MKPIRKTRVKLFHTDNLKRLRKIPDSVIDSIVTDPPYEIGFMKKGWDSTGIAYSVEFWRECLRVLKPGGHLIAFSSARTYHRMTCAIEDSGFEVRDQLMWMYGSGFPKSTNVSKEIDARQASNTIIRPWLKKLGTREEIATAGGVTPRQVDHWIGENTPCPQTLTAKRFEMLCKHFKVKPKWSAKMFPKTGKALGTKTHSRSGGNDFGKIPGAKSSKKIETIYAPATEEAKKWEGWGTGLKPAHEPICLARKPSKESVSQTVMHNGVGAINIGGTSILGEGKKRWPTNVIHDGSDEVLKLFPALKESPSKFFYCAKPNKADKTEHGQVVNRHATVKPTVLMRYLCRLVTPRRGWVLDPFMGSGTSGKAALLEGFRFVGMEKDEESFITARDRIRIAYNATKKAKVKTKKTEMKIKKKKKKAKA